MINKVSIYPIFRLVTFINYQLLSSKFETKIEDLEYIKNNFQKRQEKGAEIFRTPQEIFLNVKNGLGGDCDDYVTLICYIAHKNKIKFKYGFLKNDDNIIFHIYPILKLNNIWVNYDIWDSKNKTNKIEIFPKILGTENDKNFIINL